LGPLLFLICVHVNDIYSCIDHVTVKLFADDTNLFVVVSLDKTYIFVFGVRDDKTR